MLSVLQGGPGLKPSEGAEPTEPSDKAGSVPDRESVLSKASEEDKLPMGNLIWKGKINVILKCFYMNVKRHSQQNLET